MIKDINIRSIVNIVAAIRLGTFCLILLRVLNELGSKVGIDKIMIAPNMPLYTIVVVTLLIIAIYFVWMFFYYYRNPDKHKRKSQIIEDILFMVFATLLIVVTDTYESNYKFLYLFGIISATINAGKRYGISLSLITSGIISTIDLVCGKDLAVNTYFQNDLILCAGFIVIAWVFGEYVKTEKQRRVLEREIKHQLKRHDFIEEMLLNNEHSYDIIIDKSKEIIVIHDEEKILYANKYAMDFLGINDVNDCIQRKHQIVHEDYKEIFKKIIHLF